MYKFDLTNKCANVSKVEKVHSCLIALWHWYTVVHVYMYIHLHDIHVLCTIGMLYDVVVHTLKLKTQKKSVCELKKYTNTISYFYFLFIYYLLQIINRVVFESTTLAISQQIIVCFLFHFDWFDT